MDSAKVTIQIVTRNSQKFMAGCLDSILDQTYRDFQVLVVDNNSQDGTADFVRANYPKVAVFENNKNWGFAKANNQGIKLFNSPFIVLCNPDIILEPDWLAKVMRGVEDERHSMFSSFGGKLLKLKMVNAEINEMEKTETIDSCGLKILKNHRIVEIGAGENSSTYESRDEVFGHSGALVLFRREALEEIILKDYYHSAGDYLDSNFFFYKEDVDLAWRLQLAGWKSLFIPDAVAYHLRTVSGSQNSGTKEILANRFNQSKLARYYSYRNHFLVLLENEFAINFLYYLPFIFWYEFKKFIYVLFLETANLKVFWEILLMWPQIAKKRKHNFSRAKVAAKYVRGWIF